MSVYEFTETFKVTFKIKTDNKAKAEKAYSKLFDKNIQLGYDKWKDTELNIKVGNFKLEVLQEEE